MKSSLITHPDVLTYVAHNIRWIVLPLLRQSDQQGDILHLSQNLVSSLQRTGQQEGSKIA